MFELEEHLSPRPLHAPLPVSAEVSGVGNVAHAVELRSILSTGYYPCLDDWVSDSQLFGGCCCRCPVAMKSEADVRCDESRASGSTDLIVYHGLANIVHKIVELLRIFGVAQELHNIFLSCHQTQSFANAF